MPELEQEALYHDPPTLITHKEDPEESSVAGPSAQLSQNRQLMMRQEDAERHDDDDDDETSHPEADVADSDSDDHESTYQDAEEDAMPPDEAQQQPKPNPFDPYAAQPEEPAANDQANMAICRICFDGPDGSEDDGESLGRLLSPCRCKGTMKYVHATCLDRWRAMSARNSSVVSCDQCGAPYCFRKSKFVGLATSPSLIFVVSVFLFLTFIWTTGFIAGVVLDRYDGNLADPAKATHKAEIAGKTSWWRWLTGAQDEDSSSDGSGSSWADLDSGYSYGTYWGYGGLYYEPAAYLKLIKEAVRQFTTGEATDAVKALVRVGDDGMVLVEPERELQSEKEKGFWSSLKWEWKYGEGGIWEGQDPDKDKMKASEPEQVTNEGTFVKRTGERYDARTADSYDTKARKVASRKKAAARKKSSKRGRPAWLDKVALQFSLGFSLVGILSFVNLLLGFSFLGPFNLHNFGLGRSFARMTGGGRRNNNGRSEGVNLASIVLVILVLIGIIRALHLVYKAVKALSRRFLSRLEEAIIDWQGEDESTPSDNADVDRRRQEAAERAGLRRRRNLGAEDSEEEAELELQRDNRMAWMMARGGD